MAPRTVTYQSPLSMEFSKQEYWSGLSLPSPGHLSNPGIKPVSSALQVDSLPWWTPREAHRHRYSITKFLMSSSCILTIFLKTRSCMIRILLSVPNKDVNTLKWCGYSCCYRFTMSLSFSVKLTLLITTIWCLLSFFLVSFSESNWFSGFPFLFIKFPYTQT